MVLSTQIPRATSTAFPPELIQHTMRFDGSGRTTRRNVATQRITRFANLPTTFSGALICKS
ncbi:hypothetical protein FA15DRAFT_674181 [Coprinopsis marcescibilis]|uniref:Uncharacterized protein n=1 Tax=Coprinopsis marcescibilis TaxID=230819 RepID=A0A5C3KV17_COPMA|nr:hypothetical protein FA15DRAFT_674181 [Coprinopsis marcescibilis]